MSWAIYFLLPPPLARAISSSLLALCSCSWKEFMLAGLVKTSFLHPFFGSKGYQLHPLMFHHQHGSFLGLEIEKFVVFQIRNDGIFFLFIYHLSSKLLDSLNMKMKEAYSSSSKLVCTLHCLISWFRNREIFGLQIGNNGGYFLFMCHLSSKSLDSLRMQMKESYSSSSKLVCNFYCLISWFRNREI